MEQIALNPDILELGELKSPLLVFGGPYSNFQAVSRLKAYAEEMGIPGSQAICTGDTVAYCAQPDETVAAIREWGIHVIAGNVELQLASEADDCGCNFREGSVCDALSREWYPYTRYHLQEEHIRWMRTLPKRLRFTLCGYCFAAVHGTFSQTADYVFGSTGWEVKQRELDTAGADIVIGGHSGLPFIDARGRKVWANAGAIGMPANDGTPRVWAMRVSASLEGLRLETFPLEYDYKTASQKMNEAGLPEGYAETLLTGLWPSCDNLAPDEAARQGILVEPSDVCLSAS